MEHIGIGCAITSESSQEVQGKSTHTLKRRWTAANILQGLALPINKGKPLAI